MDLTKALDIVKRASQQEKLRLKRGLMRRQQILEAQEQGEEPTGPRVDWLRETAQELMRVLGEQADKFNAANVDDMISAHDLCDALATAIATIQETTEG